VAVLVEIRSRDRQAPQLGARAQQQPVVPDALGVLEHDLCRRLLDPLDGRLGAQLDVVGLVEVLART